MIALRRALLTVTLLLTLGSGAAQANPYVAREQAETTRLDPQVEVELLEVPVTLELPTLRTASLGDLEASQAIELRMGELAPEELALSFDLHPATTVYVTADLDAELPRLDALDGDTYFTVGVELHVTRALGLFVEDFQPASLVVGDSEELQRHPPPLRSWDGHQVSVGLRWNPCSRGRIEAAAVLHVLSATQRTSSVGALVSLSVSF